MVLFACLATEVSAFSERHLKRLEKTGDCKRCKLDRDDLSGLFLIAADLRGTSLQRATLKDAYLESVDLSKSNLSESNLTGAYLKAVSYTHLRAHETDS